MTDNSSLLTVEQADVWTAAWQPDNHNADPVSTQMRRPYSTNMIVYLGTDGRCGFNELSVSIYDARL